MTDLSDRKASDHGGARCGCDRRKKGSEETQTERRSGLERRVRTDRREANGRRRGAINGEAVERRDEYRGVDDQMPPDPFPDSA